MEMIKDNRPFDLITMGEILLRLSPTGQQPLADCEALCLQLGGSELNVAAGVAQLGGKAAFLGRLPNHNLGQCAARRLRATGVSDRILLWDDSPEARLGLYYYENATAPRRPSVIYDRANSSMSRIQPELLDPSLFSQARCFHVSGITLAISDSAQQTALAAMAGFRATGAKVSFDVNYRARLWDEEAARETIEELLPLVDILFISEESCRRMFHQAGPLPEVLKGFAVQYGLEIVAASQRTVHSPRRHSFTSLLYDAASDCCYTEPPYQDIEIVDRIGSGDAYNAGVLYGLLSGAGPGRALSIGNAAAAIKCTVPGDLPVLDPLELAEITSGHQGPTADYELRR